MLSMQAGDAMAASLIVKNVQSALEAAAASTALACVPVPGDRL